MLPEREQNTSDDNGREKYKRELSQKEKRELLEKRQWEGGGAAPGGYYSQRGCGQVHLARKSHPITKNKFSFSIDF